MKVTIHLPVTPAIKKFLEVRLGKEYKLTANDWFGPIILSILENKTNKHYEINCKNNQLRTSTFDITVSLSMAEKAGFIIAPRQENIINQIVEGIFREDMYLQSILNKKMYLIDYQTTISTILDSYDITDEEMNYESIKRDFNRKRAALEEKLYL